MSLDRVNKMLRDVVGELGEGQLYSIGSGGMTKLKTGKILIQPNTFYYMGASSSPKRILVTKVDKDKIYYRGYPHGVGRELVVDRRIGEDLILKGIATWLKMGYQKYPWGKKEAANLKKLLAGKSVKPVNPKDYIPVTVTVVAAKGVKTGEGGKDLWYDAEHYGGVGGREGPDGYEYEISMDTGVLKKLRKDKKFKVISVKKG
jgi:hypothetical protein